MAEPDDPEDDSSTSGEEAPKPVPRWQLDGFEVALIGGSLLVLLAIALVTAALTVA